MKQKFLIIHLLTGRVVKRDITNTLPKNIPIGAKANDASFQQWAHTVANIGFTDIDNSTENRLIYIAPAMIQSVEIVFE